MGLPSIRTLAVLEAATESASIFGGKSRAWSEIAAIWVDLKPTGHRQDVATLYETAEAETRTQAAASRGQRLKAGGSPWSIVAVTPSSPRPGRMTLKLERVWP